MDAVPEAAAVVPPPARRRSAWPYVAAGVALLVAAVAYFQVTIFVIQPIGAVPEGRTLVLWRKSPGLVMIDSADGLCERQQGGVSLMCRLGALAGVMNNNPVLLTLPYSKTLYGISTGGREYDR